MISYSDGRRQICIYVISIPYIYIYIYICLFNTCSADVCGRIGVYNQDEGENELLGYIRWYRHHKTF